MTTTTIDKIEYNAWRLAAEPSPARMDTLLESVRELAGLSDEDAQAPQGDFARTYVRNDVEVAETPEAVSGTLQDVLTSVPNDDSANDTAEKLCPKCDEWKLATSENFTKDKTQDDGLRYRCKACDAEARGRRVRRDDDAVPGVELP